MVVSETALFFQKILKSWRVDAKNCGDKSNEIDVICKDCYTGEPEWFTDFEGKGKVVQGNNEYQEIIIRTKNEGNLKLYFRGIKEVFNNDNLKIFANFDSIKINGNDVLFHNKKIWHDEPYSIFYKTYKFQEIKINIKMQYAAYSMNELDEILKNLCEKYNKSISQDDILYLRSIFLVDRKNDNQKDNTKNYKDIFISSERNMNLEEIKKHISGRINIISDGVIFRSVFIDSSIKKLYVFLSAVGKNTTQYPKFLRKSWSSYFDGLLLYIDDPTRFNKNFAPAFYFGEKNKPYLKILKKLF